MVINITLDCRHLLAKNNEKVLSLIREYKKEIVDALKRLSKENNIIVFKNNKGSIGYLGDVYDNGVRSSWINLYFKELGDAISFTISPIDSLRVQCRLVDDVCFKVDLSYNI